MHHFLWKKINLRAKMDSHQLTWTKAKRSLRKKMVKFDMILLSRAARWMQNSLKLHRAILLNNVNHLLQSNQFHSLKINEIFVYIVKESWRHCSWQFNYERIGKLLKNAKSPIFVNHHKHQITFEAFQIESGQSGRSLIHYDSFLYDMIGFFG